MGKTHVVEQGEHLSVIADRYGFLDYRLIWDHPQNEGLRGKRESPNVLLPGDVLFVPDKETKAPAASTNATHRFVVNRPKVQLRIAFLDFHGRPLAGTACSVEAEGSLEELNADGDGVVERDIQRRASVGVVQVGGAEFPIRIGDLDPVESESGWKARLANLGYLDVDLSGADERATRAALEEFQCDQDLAVTGEADADTLQALKAAYGC